MIKVIKRDNREVEFEENKIIKAIAKAAADVYGKIDYKQAEELSKAVIENIRKNYKTIHVEEIQDIVELELMKVDGKVAKSYILYRNERKKNRKNFPYQFIKPETISKYKHLPDPFPSELGKIVYYRTYSRPIEEENRREYWWETVARVVEYSSFLEKEAISRKRPVTPHDIARLQDEADELFDAIFNLKLFPSGRSLWVANTKSSKMYPLSNFNCSFVVIDSFKKFSEIFSVLMLGTGAGLSVEKQYIDKLPKVNTTIEVIHKDIKRVNKNERKEYSELKQIAKNVMEIVVGDSKFGWSTALDFYFQIITQKQYKDIEFILVNYDNVRPAGERLRTFGGYASGEQAIKQMFDKINKLITSKKENGQWYKIKPIDALDIATIIAENVISGGVRRSSEIVFCDPDDKEVIEAKNNLYVKNKNDEWVVNEDLIHRSLSNNTILYKEKPSPEQLKEHFQSMRFSAEPGFGNLQAMQKRRPDAQGGNPLTL